MQDEIVGLRDALKEYTDVMKRHDAGSNSNISTMSVNAGPVGMWIAVWVATVCCAVMLTLSMVSRADQIDQKRRLDVANDKLSVILQWAPELAKKVDQQTTEKTKGI